MEKCRLCYSDTDPELCQNIFNTKLDPPLWKIIKQLSDLIIWESDPYTKIVCFECFVELKKFIKFRQMIHDSDYRFQHNGQLSNNTNNCGYYSPISLQLKEETTEEDSLKIENARDNTNTDHNKSIDNGIVCNISHNDYSNCNEAISNKDVHRCNKCNKKCLRKNHLKLHQFKVHRNITQPQNEGNKAEQELHSNISDLNTTYIDNIDKKSKRNRISSTGCSCEQQKDVDSDKKSQKCDKISKRHTKRYLTDGNVKRTYPCTICNKQFTRTCNLNDHLRVHTGEKPFTCLNCNQKFTNKSTLTVHMRLHTGEKPYQCDICKWRFRHVCNLKNHSIVHTGEKPYDCTVCNGKFPTRQALRRHEKRVHANEKF